MSAPTTTAGAARASSTTSSAPTTSTTSAPTQTLPWIDVTVEPNTRNMFRHTLDASGVHNPPACTLDHLLVTADFGGAGGTLYAGIDVRNRTPRPCYVRGSPYVGFLDGAGDSLAAYLPHLGASDPRVVLVPASWAQLGLTSVGGDNCGAGGTAPAGPATTAIRFGLDSISTRVVRVQAPDRCLPSAFGHAGAFQAIAVDSVYGSLYAPLRDGLALEVPTKVVRGRTLDYSITLTDTDLNVFPLVGDGCPLYNVSLGATKSRTLLLNCNGSRGLLIAPATSVRIDMHFAVPASQPLGTATLTWHFVEPQEPAMSARVTVVNQTG